MTDVARFLGLNHGTDPLSLGLSWLVQADDVDITDAGKLVKRTGYGAPLAATSLTGAYATRDEQRAYFVDNGALKAVTGAPGALATITLATGLAAAPVYWAEINGEVFFSNGIDSGIIRPDQTLLPWAWPVPGAPTLAAVSGTLSAGQYGAFCTFTLPDGRMTGTSQLATLVLEAGHALQITNIPQIAGLATNVYIAPADSAVYGLAASNAGAVLRWDAPANALGRALRTSNFSPLPAGCDVIQAWRGQLFAAMPMDNCTAIWESQPLGFHLFNLRDDFKLIPGRVLMMAPTESALIIATERETFAWNGERLAKLADYGVVPGHHWAQEDDGNVLFWSTRGVCRALPFANLTERRISVAPGRLAGGALLRRGGQLHYLVALQQGGSAFNSFN